MSEDRNDQLNAGLPWAQWPVGDATNPLPPLDYNTVWPELPERIQPPPDASNYDPTTFGKVLYVMRSKKFGSSDPTDDTAPLGLSVANPDTFQSWNPPMKVVVGILTVVSDGPTRAQIETDGAHGIPSVGGPFMVVISDSNSVPAVDGTWPAIYVDATNYTITIPAPITVSGTAAGTSALPCNACEALDGPREYSHATEGLLVFKDTCMSDHGFFNTIYDRFTRKRTDYIGGAFEWSGEESAPQLSNFTMTAT